MLIELHHPFVNWEYVLTQLKGLSIGDFYDFNIHEDGLSALKTLADIYLAVISSARDEEVKDNAVRYLLRISQYRSFQQRQPSGEKHGPVFTPLSIACRSFADPGSSVEEIIQLYEGNGQD